MYFEPGKYIFAEAGILLTEVNTIKHNRTRVIAGCDSGFPQLIRPMLYDAYHQIWNLSNPDGKPQVYDVCGNICETGDRFAEQRELPEIREYDILAIGNAGAYCYAMGGVYNLRAMLYLAQISSGESQIELLKQVIRDYSDCWYFNGVQVGAYARFILGSLLEKDGRHAEAVACFDELIRLYPDAIGHNGKPLSADLPK